MAIIKNFNLTKTDLEDVKWKKKNLSMLKSQK